MRTCAAKLPSVRVACALRVHVQAERGICVTVCPTPLSSAANGAEPASQQLMFLRRLQSCFFFFPSLPNRTFLYQPEPYMLHGSGLPLTLPPSLLLLSLPPSRVALLLSPAARPPSPLTFFFSFFSSFLVKRVWTHQILVNMLPYARLKPRPSSHKRNWQDREKTGREIRAGPGSEGARRKRSLLKRRHSFSDVEARF